MKRIFKLKNKGFCLSFISQILLFLLTITLFYCLLLILYENNLLKN